MAEQVGEHRRLADLDFLRRSENRNRSLVGKGFQVGECLSRFAIVKLGAVAAAELVEPLRIVPVPGA